jgi:sec-independent protein translocase protein TatB
MFDVGGGEMLIIAIVALIVLGPERLPKAARFAGLWVRRARAQWYSVKAELENELDAEDLKRQLREPADELDRQVREPAAELGRQLRAPLNEIRESLDDVDPAAVMQATPAPVRTPPPGDPS